MKKLVLILAALSLVAFLAVPTPAQTPTRVRVEVDVPPPAKTYAPVAVRPVYADAPPPPPVLLPAGSGCYGTHAAGGCFGRSGGSCYGRAAGAGCYGSGGCYGSVPVAGYAYAAPMPVAVAPYGAYVGGGRYATRTGRPPAPGIVPSNDPLTKTLRWWAGFDTEY